MMVVPEDGMRITRDTVLQPGVYFLPNGIEIAADGITLDGNGALLIGAGFQGRGVTIKHHSSVTVRRLHLERYYHGIAATGCANLRIEDCAITRTHELAAPDVFLDVWLDRSEAYGGAVFLNGVIDSVLTGNDVQHQQSGLLLYGCNRVEIARNNASHNSGYGVLLYESSENTVRDNVADYCCRIFSSNPASGRYHNGADAAALVMMCNSSKNVVTGNMLRSGGDGVFLGGFHKDEVVVSCNDNVFERNDGSDSPNIAFEATFSQRNVFRNNKASNCNYGFWLGWSSENTVEGNEVKHNRIAGVAIEHGHHNTIKANAFEKNRDGVQLWVNLDEQRGAALFRQYFPDSAESHSTAIQDNTFTRHDHAIRCWSVRGEQPLMRCRNFALTGNTLTDNRIAVQMERVRESQILRNTIRDNIEAGVKLIGCEGIIVENNDM
jgi:parallel beta-helix repeat protein